jgi:predicted DNA-binding antitoxin AbrB/MazE fold protein
MVVKVRYENGVFRLLEDVPVKEGTIAEVYLPAERDNGKRKSVRDYAACGMWADRTDFSDGEHYGARMRKYRQEPEAEPRDGVK